MHVGSIRYLVLGAQGPDGAVSVELVGPQAPVPYLLPVSGSGRLGSAPVLPPRASFGAAQAVGGMCVAFQECTKEPDA